MIKPEEAAPWTLRLCAADQEPDLVEPLRPAYALWASRRAGHRIPAWRDFSFFDFRRWQGRIAAEDIIRDPFDLRMRLWGVGLTDLYGFELSGRLMSETIALRGLQMRDIEFLKSVCLETRIGVSSGTIDWRGRHHVRVVRLFLPCAHDHAHADILLTVTWRAGNDRSDRPELMTAT